MSDPTAPHGETARHAQAHILGLLVEIAWDVAQHAREIDPHFPVVYMSGKDTEDWAPRGVPNSIMLEKPFAPAQLVTAVANLLNSGTPTR